MENLLMVIARLFYDGNLKKRKVDKNDKIKSDYYEKWVLKFVLKEDIISLYPRNIHCVKLQKDKATRLASKSTAVFTESKQKGEIK